MSTPKKKKRTWAGPLTEHDKAALSHASGGPIDPKKIHVGPEGPEVFVPPSVAETVIHTDTVNVTLADERTAQLERKIEGAKIYFREIMANGRNPASGMARKALAELES